MESKDSQEKPVHVLRPDATEINIRELIREEPLAVRVQDETYATIMRTPGRETFLAAGFCLAEGLVDKKEDFLSIGHCADMDPNVVEVSLTPERAEKVQPLLQSKSFLSQTSCGVCGRTMIDDLAGLLTPGRQDLSLTVPQALDCLERLNGLQDLRNRTRAAHGVYLADENLETLTWAEDAGRHNALDKAVGAALLAGTLGRVRLAVLSSRISFEMVQKCARAGAAVVCAWSRPTALAVDVAEKMDLTLCGPAPGQGLFVYTHKRRVVSG